MIIRKMTIGDYEEAFEMWLQAGESGIRTKEDSHEGIERFLERNPDTSFIAEIDGRIVGVLMCGQDGRRGYIYHTAIRDPSRSRTIGKALLSAMSEAMNRLQIAKVGLLIDGENDSGSVFWEQQGWIKRDDLMYFNRIIENDIGK